MYGAGAAAMQDARFPEYASADHPTQVLVFSASVGKLDFLRVKIELTLDDLTLTRPAGSQKNF
jgi:hypothetical protein